VSVSNLGSGRAGQRHIMSARLLANTVLPPVALAVLVIAAWWVAADAAHSTVFPAPLESITSLFDNLRLTEFDSSVIATLELLAESYIAAVLVGAVIGVLIGISKFWTDAVSPIIYAANSLPKIVLFPVFLIFLGIGEPSRVAFAFVSGVMPMLLIVLEGAAAVKLVHLKLAASLNMSYPTLIRKIVLPSMVPSLATGARLTFGLTFVGLLVVEMFAGTGGLGYELLHNVTLVRLQDILGDVVLIVVISLVPTFFLRWLEAKARARFGA
jgi:NitT/TauT family transport system permease protein